MPTIEEIYKAKGYTDEAIAAIKPLLDDQKLRSVLEEEFTRLGQEVTSFKTENENWSKWHEETAKPTLALYEQDVTNAKADNASLKERLRLAEEAGFAPRRAEPTPTTTTTPAGTPEAFDPKKHNLVTTADVQRFAELEGQAIARSGDLIEEYRYLTGGKSLIDYEYKTADGRTLRGLQAIRNEAEQAKQPWDTFAAKKFDFEGKRNAIAETQRAAAEKAIRDDERAKVMQQNFQPGQAPLMPSRDPFIPRPREGSEGKQPWDRGTDNERRAARINNAMQTQLRSVQ
jgi:hypothetical protein